MKVYVTRWCDDFRLFATLEQAKVADSQEWEQIDEWELIDGKLEPNDISRWRCSECKQFFVVASAPLFDMRCRPCGGKQAE